MHILFSGCVVASSVKYTLTSPLSPGKETSAVFFVFVPRSFSGCQQNENLVRFLLGRVLPQNKLAPNSGSSKFLPSECFFLLAPPVDKVF